jgi:hypothetical protein
MRASEFITEDSGLMYFGDKCTKDCSGHRAGRAWATKKGISTPNQMPFGGSNSFYQGGTTYTKDKNVQNQRLKKKATVNQRTQAAQPATQPPQ